MKRRVAKMVATVLVAVLGGTLLSPTLAQAAAALPTGLSLPFAEGLTNFTSGPHTWDGTASGNRGSVDFGSPDGSEQHVYASAGGKAYVYNDLGWKRCYVIVDHGNGWQTAYYHLKNVPLDLNNKTVKKGDVVGDMGAIGVDTCGGGTPGYRHVHFVLLYQWNEYPIDGLSLGGYTIHEAVGPYCGSWTRNSDNAVVAESLVLQPPSQTWPEGRCVRMEPGLTNGQTQSPAPTVTASPVAGTYGPTTTIALTSNDPAASIYYTTDGTAPSAASAKYSSPLPMASMTLSYIAVSTGGVASVTASQTYTLDATAPAISVAPAAGAYPAGTQITLTADDGTLYCTTDGSTPATTGAPCSGIFTLNAAMTLKAVAVDAYGNTSSPFTANYTVVTTPGVALNLLPQSGPQMSRIAVVRTATRTVAFGIGPNNALYARWGTGDWAVVPKSKAAKDVAAYVNPDGRVGFFYITTGGAMYSTWENTVGGSLASFVSRGTGWTSVAATGRPSAGWHMFATNKSGVVYRLSPYDGVNSSTSFGTTSGFVKVSAATDANGRLIVLAVKANGDMYRRTQAAVNGSFSAWTLLTGSAAADMAVVADSTNGWVIYRIDPSRNPFVWSEATGWRSITFNDPTFSPDRIAVSTGAGTLSVLALNSTTGLMQGN